MKQVLGVSDMTTDKRQEAVAYAVEYLNRLYSREDKPLDFVDEHLMLQYKNVQPDSEHFDDNGFLSIIYMAQLNKDELTQNYYELLQRVCADWAYSGKPIPKMVADCIADFISGKLQPPPVKVGRKKREKSSTLAGLCLLINKEFGFPFDKNAASTHNDFVYAIIEDAARECGIGHEVFENTIRSSHKDMQALFARHR